VYGSQLALVLFVIAAAAVLARFRAATGTERQQLKWFAYASSIVMLFFVAATFGLFPYLAGFGPLVAALTLDLIPIAVAIAILRYRLYDIDVLIRRTLTYAVLSAVLFAAYLSGVGVIQVVVSPI